MGFERNFAVGFGWRLLLLFATVGALALALWQPGFAAVRIVAGVLVVGAAWSLYQYIGRTNRELARFVEGLKYGDLNQGFGRLAGGGFDELGQALGDAMRQLRSERARASDEARVHAALADEAPSAMLLIDEDDRVTLANKAARKLFHRLGGTRVEDFAPYGTDLVALMRGDGNAERKIATLRIDEVAQRAMVSRAGIERLGRSLTIVAVQPIQQELSSVELAAQADLVRVLTHEIMNSMTPVVSLAESAARLMAQVAVDGDPAVEDARAAIDTLARRASGIMHFVESYRAFSCPPVVQRRLFPASLWAEELRRLFLASKAAAEAALEIAINPPDLSIDGDPDLLAQVAINLIKNGAEAACECRTDARVVLSIAPLPGGRTMISIRDNGPGITPALADEIFLPFFTTKAAGTGVGLSLARRIMIAHGGSIALGASSEGACFEMVV